MKKKTCKYRCKGICTIEFKPTTCNNCRLEGDLSIDKWDINNPELIKWLIKLLKESRDSLLDLIDLAEQQKVPHSTFIGTAQRIAKNIQDTCTQVKGLFV